MRPSSRATKIAVLGGIAGFVVLLFVFFSPMLGLVRHRYALLPIYGERETVPVMRDGVPGVDTLYHTVPPFAFIDMFGRPFTDRDVEGKVIVADFFFTRCTTICPRMSLQMQQLQLKLNDKAFDDVVFLSHTVDPEHDTPEVLREYARRYKADTARWKFLTGNAPDIYRQGNTGYLLSAVEDSTAAERFVHDARFVLVDRERRIRGFYDGTVTAEVDKLVTDLKMLLKEEKLRARDNR